MKSAVLIGITFLTTATSSFAHEYWLDPFDSSVATGDSAIVDVRNGQDFNGSAFPYNTNRFESITIKSRSDNQPYTGRLGDYPALHPAFSTKGLYSINVSTFGTLLTYDSWEKFNVFLEYHGFDNVAARHIERGLSKTDVTEQYFRSAKTIIQVSDTGDLVLDDVKSANVEEHNAFAATGIPFEMLLLDNPYSKIGSIRIKLLFNSKPLANRQAEMFWKGDTIERQVTKTDEDGVATFELLGKGDYMLNAVEVSEPNSKKVDWLSHWASITFER